MSVNLTAQLFNSTIIPSVEVKGELSLVDPQSNNQFDISRVFHCDGLLLCTSKDESRFVVRNPFTGETRWFEPGEPRKKDRDFVLGYTKPCNKKSYKILSHDPYTKESEIYEFNSDSWRILDDISPGWSFSYSFHCSVSLKGNTYVFAYDETKTQLSLSLPKFDFSTEKSEHVPLPRQWPRYEATGLSVVKEEKLSVLLQYDSTSKTEIWMTNKIDETTRVVSWSKVLALDLSHDLQIWFEVNFLLDEEKKILVCIERWIDMEKEYYCKDIIYTVGEDNKVTQITLGVDTYDLCRLAIFNYVPSLAQIEGARGKSKRKRDD